MADSNYSMPFPSDIVLWSYTRGGEQVPAFVTQRGQHMISVLTFIEGVLVPHECVRHVSDPWLEKNLLDPDYGIWEYTNDTMLLYELAGTFLPDSKYVKKSKTKQLLTKTFTAKKPVGVGTEE